MLPSQRQQRESLVLIGAVDPPRDFWWAFSIALLEPNPLFDRSESGWQRNLMEHGDETLFLSLSFRASD